MTELIKLLVSHFAILFDQHLFYIKDSDNSGNQFSGASILLDSPTFQIYLAFERNQISAQFHSVFDDRDGKWYSTDVLLAYLGHKDCLGVLDDRTSAILKQSMPQIVEMFDEENCQEILRELDRIEKDQ